MGILDKLKKATSKPASEITKTTLHETKPTPAKKPKQSTTGQPTQTSKTLTSTTKTSRELPATAPEVQRESELPWLYVKNSKVGKRIVVQHTKERGVITEDLSSQYIVRLDDTGEEVWVFKRDKHLVEE